MVKICMVPIALESQDSGDCCLLDSCRKRNHKASLIRDREIDGISHNKRLGYKEREIIWDFFKQLLLRYSLYTIKLPVINVILYFC